MIRDAAFDTSRIYFRFTFAAGTWRLAAGRGGGSIREEFVSFSCATYAGMEPHSRAAFMCVDNATRIIGYRGENILACVNRERLDDRRAGTSRRETSSLETAVE